MADHDAKLGCVDHTSDNPRSLTTGDDCARCRPVNETFRDTRSRLQDDGWLAPLAHDVPRVGIDPAKEQRILDAVS